MSQVLQSPYEKKTPVVWSLQSASVKMLGSDSKGVDAGILAAVQGVTINFTREVNTRYPLSGGAPIKLVGHPTGTVQLQTIIGPGSVVDAFLTKFGSACSTFQLEIATSTSDKTKCEGAQQILPQTLRLKGCFGQGVSFSLSTQGALTIAQGTFTAIFDDFDWKSSASK